MSFGDRDRPISLSFPFLQLASPYFRCILPWNVSSYYGNTMADKSVEGIREDGSPSPTRRASVSLSPGSVTAQTWTLDRSAISMRSYRRGVPVLPPLDWLRGIVSAGERKGSIGVVVWKAPHGRDDDAVVLLRLRDWEALHGD